MEKPRIRCSAAIYAGLLRLYPEPFRRRNGDAMQCVFVEACSAARGFRGGAALWHDTVSDLVISAAAEHFDELRPLFASFGFGAAAFLVIAIPLACVLMSLSGALGGAARPRVLFLASSAIDVAVIWGTAALAATLSRRTREQWRRVQRLARVAVFSLVGLAAAALASATLRGEDVRVAVPSLLIWLIAPTLLLFLVGVFFLMDPLQRSRPR